MISRSIICPFCQYEYNDRLNLKYGFLYMTKTRRYRKAMRLDRKFDKKECIK